MLLIPDERIQAQMALDAALQIRDSINSSDEDRLRIAGFNRVGERWVQIFFEDKAVEDSRLVVKWSTDLDVGDTVRLIRESMQLPALNDSL